MDIDLLKTFIEVSRTRHFGQAAENLFVSQSTVSARIRLLEQMVGSPLFARERNNNQLTEAGEQLLIHAESILHTWKQACLELATRDRQSESLVVGAIPSLWDDFLLDWVAALHQQNRGLVLALEVHPGDALTRRLFDATLDLGFTFEAPRTPELIVREVTRFPLILVSTESGIAPRAAFENYISVDWGASFSLEHARHFPRKNAPVMRVGLARLALALILDHGGAAYLAKQMIEKAIVRGELHEVAGAPVIECPAYAVYSTQNAKLALIEQCLASIDAPSV